MKNETRSPNGSTHFLNTLMTDSEYSSTQPPTPHSAVTGTRKAWWQMGQRLEVALLELILLPGRFEWKSFIERSIFFINFKLV